MTNTVQPTARIPLASIAPSPTNPRKRFDPKALAELAEDIKRHDVLQAVLVRPNGADGAYELVFGERRFRAAKIAGLQDIPANVRTLSDAEVIEIQVVENIQRKDLHELEEAEGYEQLMKIGHQDGTKYSVEEIADKVSMSPSYVRARLKLCALCPEARKAFYDGVIDASKALLVARIGHHETQQQALKDITDDGDRMSFREAQQHIIQRYMLQLKSAPFDIKDASLLPKAGACGPCPKRTGNQADLFGDVKSADVCTDPKCFSDKRIAHYSKAVKDLEAKGRKVIHGEDAKKVFPQWDHHDPHWAAEISDRYLPMTGHIWTGQRQVSVRDALGADYEPVVVQHPATGKVVEVASRKAVDDAKAAGSGRTKSTAKAKPSKPKGPDVDEVLTERLAQLIFKKAPKQFSKTWLAALAQQMVKHLSTRDLDAVALAWGWKSSAFKSGSYSSRKLPAEASKLGDRDLVLLMFHICFAIGAYTRGDVLKLFGIKEQEIREQILEERKAAAKKAREEAKAAKEKKATPAKKGLAALGIKAKKKATPARAAMEKRHLARQASFMRPMTPSAELAAIVGTTPMPRTEVTSKIWGYIKKHSLQDQMNRRMINVDDKLRPILGNKKQVSMFAMTNSIAKHLK